MSLCQFQPSSICFHETRNGNKILCCCVKVTHLIYCVYMARFTVAKLRRFHCGFILQLVALL